MRRICQYIVKPADMIDDAEIPDHVYRKYDWMLARAWEETFTEYAYLTYSNEELAVEWNLNERAVREILSAMRELGLIKTEQEGRTRRKIYLLVAWRGKGSDSARNNATAPSAKRLVAQPVSAKAEQVELIDRPLAEDEFDESTDVAVSEGGAQSAALAGGSNSISTSFNELKEINSSININPRANDIWHDTLGELQLQMTRATFDSWVRPSRAVSFDGDQLVVQVRSPYAKEWLEARLNMTIQRTVTGIVGKSVTVRYEVENK